MGFSGRGLRAQSNVIMPRRNVFKYIYGGHKCEHREIIFIYRYTWSESRRVGDATVLGGSFIHFSIDKW